MTITNQYQYNSIPLYFLFTLCFAAVASVHVEIKNNETSYKLVLEGKAGRIDDRLVLNPVV